MTIRAIIFDLDDTLFNEREYVLSGLMAVDDWVLQNLNTTGFFDIAYSLFSTGENKFIFNKSFEKLNVNYNDNIIKDMLNTYRSHEPKINLLPDAMWVLNHLNNNVKLGLISDGYFISQQKKVKALKLNEWFHSIILSDFFGKKHWKPSYIPYRQASIELQCTHKECVYVGDNVTKDFITAKKLGWKTVHVKRSAGVYHDVEMDPEYHAHYQVNSLLELSKINELKHLFT